MSVQSQDDLDEARKVYEDLNSELNAELPDLYERSAAEGATGHRSVDVNLLNLTGTAKM